MGGVKPAWPMGTPRGHSSPQQLCPSGSGKGTISVLKVVQVGQGASGLLQPWGSSCLTALRRGKDGKHCSTNVSVKNHKEMETQNRGELQLGSCWGSA